MSRIIPIIFIFAIFFSARTFTSNSNQTPTPSSTPNADTNTQEAVQGIPIQTETETKTYTEDELSQHNSKQDCWLAIEGNVYDVTNFIPQHPGGKAILEGCGTNATQLFNTRPMGSNTPHSPKAREKLPNFYIGKLTDKLN